MNGTATTFMILHTILRYKEKKGVCFPPICELLPGQGFAPTLVQGKRKALPLPSMSSAIFNSARLQLEARQRIFRHGLDRDTQIERDMQFLLNV